MKNVHEETFLLTLAVDQDETAEIDREMRQRGDVEPPYFIWTRLGRWVSSDYNDSVFFARRKQVPQSAWSKKKKTDVQNWKNVKR